MTAFINLSSTTKTHSPLRLIIMLCLISSIGRFVIDSYLPSIPAMVTDLGLNTRHSEWTMTLYLLGFGLSQPIYGVLSDLWGRRILLLLGLIVFLFGSLGCMLAPNGAVLLCCRLLSGFGAGACGVLNRAIASDCFKGADFAKAWSYTTTVLVLTLIIAPVVGSLVQQLASWRANFLLSFAFVALILVLIYRFLPETTTVKQRANYQISSAVIHYRHMLTSRGFMIPTLIYALSFAGLMAYFQVSALLLIQQFHFTELAYGLSSLGIATSYLLGGKLVRATVASVGAEGLLFIGIILLLLGGMVMVYSGVFHTIHWQGFVIAAMVYTLGARLIIPNATALAMREFRHVAGSASALIGCSQMLVAMALSALLSLFSVVSILPLACLMLTIGMLTMLIASWNYRAYYQNYLTVIKIVIKKLCRLNKRSTTYLVG